MWQAPYEAINYRGGKPLYICDDMEDMIEIHYADGMLIDIGKAESDGVYYITVVASDDVSGWQHPLLELPVQQKALLPEQIQMVIDQFRR